MSDDLYDDHILDHYESPYHRGHLDMPTIAHEDENPLCGDQIEVFILVDEDTGKIEDVRFKGAGCAISKASASIMTTLLKGKTIEEAKELFEQFHKVVTSDPTNGGVTPGESKNPFDINALNRGLSMAGI